MDRQTAKIHCIQLKARQLLKSRKIQHLRLVAKTATHATYKQSLRVLSDYHEAGHKQTLSAILSSEAKITGIMMARGRELDREKTSFR